MRRTAKGKRGQGAYAGAVSSYLRSIGRFSLLTTSGEFRLASASRLGVESARRALVEANLRLVVKIAFEYHRDGVPIEDLISEGNIGLVEAARRFDLSKGVRFSSYAVWWIRKYIVSFLDRQRIETSSPARPGPLGAQDGYGDGVRPRQEAVPPRRGARRQRILSFDELLLAGGGKGFPASETAPPNGSADEVILEKELADAIRSVLPHLRGRERSILESHYGLDGGEPRTLKQIGALLGYTRERVRQLEVRAIDRVRRILAARRRRPLR